MMPVPTSRIFPTDEELGKRDDNYRPARASPATMSTLPSMLRRRRVFILLVLAGLGYLFVHYIPTDLGSIDQRMGRPLRPGHTVVRQDPSRARRPAPWDEERDQPAPIDSVDRTRTESRKSKDVGPDGAPPRPDDEEDELPNKLFDDDGQAHHYYSGRIRYYKLASSLSKVERTQGRSRLDRSVLFAVSSMRSAANLLPMACKMADSAKSQVHFILLGRASLPIDELLEVNGLTKCEAVLHDGRPNYTQWSTDTRAEASVGGAMRHVQSHMHPQVIITDSPDVEDGFFVRGIRAAAQTIDRPLIELPEGKYHDLQWICRLDAASLAAWHKPQIEILVHVEPGTAGGVVQLLDSLEAADYSGFNLPRLTIELPSDVDPFVKDHLRGFRWPPVGDDQEARFVPQFAPRIHHRITTNTMTPEESSVRFFESFYSVNKDYSHVLLLSPQVELSPMFYHYLVYTILQTQYSSSRYLDTELVFGIGLTTPDFTLDDKTPLVLPDATGRSVFHWQAPNAEAMLIFGAKWVEAHSYLTHRLRTFYDRPSKVKQQTKQVAASKPAWMEYLTELFQARGYSTLYPLLPPRNGQPSTWAKVHRELFRVPEEHRRLNTVRTSKSEAVDAASADGSQQPFLSGPENVHVVRPKRERNTPLAGTGGGALTLQDLLPKTETDDLLDITGVPYLDMKGSTTTFERARRDAREFAAALRTRVGGCNEGEIGGVKDKNGQLPEDSADDLFCVRASEPEQADRIADAKEVRTPDGKEKPDASIAAADVDTRAKADVDAAVDA